MRTAPQSSAQKPVPTMAAKYLVEMCFFSPHNEFKYDIEIQVTGSGHDFSRSAMDISERT